MADFQSKRDELLKILPYTQCFKCQDVPRPGQMNRYSCLNEGHFLCENDKAEECPCGSLVAKKPSPFVAMLLNGMPWMCQNYKNGCREMIVHVEDLKNHEQKCTLRNICCPFFDCQVEILFKDVKGHLQKFHKNDFKRVLKAGRIGQIPMDNFEFDFDCEIGLCERSLDDHVFYEVVFCHENTFRFWFYLLGSPDEARNFSFSYSVKNKNGEKFMYTGPVHALDENFYEIVDSNSLFKIEANVVDRFLNGQNELEIRRIIRNVKETAEDDEKPGISGDE